MPAAVEMEAASCADNPTDSEVAALRAALEATTITPPRRPIGRCPRPLPVHTHRLLLQLPRGQTPA
eukprot:11180993-Lingulodinium_polyedra.AAC.1